MLGLVRRLLGIAPPVPAVDEAQWRRVDRTLPFLDHLPPELRPRLREMALAREDVSALGAIMKLVQTEQEVAKYELLQQLMGQQGLALEGDGVTADELAVCRLWLYSKSYTIAGGSSEIQLNIIARRVLGLPT